MFYTGEDLHGLPDPQSQKGFYEAVPAKRLGAFVIDAVIIGILSALAIPLTAFIGALFFPLLVVMVSFGYRVLTLSHSSATTGMSLMGIEFRTHKGERFDRHIALIHTALFTLWLLIGFLNLASIILMLTTQRKQSLSDVILGTAAINRASEY